MDKLVKIFASILNIDESHVIPSLSPENTPSWDSLNAIILVSEVEHVYDIKFTYDEIVAIKDFAGVADLLNRKGIILT